MKIKIDLTCSKEANRSNLQELQQLWGKSIVVVKTDSTGHPIEFLVPDFRASIWFDGRFGTRRGEVEKEFFVTSRSMSPLSPKKAFRRAFGFSPNGRISLGYGYRYINEKGFSLDSRMYQLDKPGVN